MGFYVGQKVECINGDLSCSIGTEGDYPIEGNIYTISKIMSVRGHLGIDLWELLPDDKGNVRWRASRFRPLTSRPTSISIFTAMLGPYQKETIDGR